MIAAGRAPGEAEPPRAPIEYAREFVMRGVPLDAMLRGYYVGHSVFFSRCAAALREHVSDPAELADVIEASATWTFQFVQALTRDLIERYATERERWVRSAASLRSETVHALLAGDELDAATASRRLRHELDREHVAFVVWADDHEHAGALEDQAAQLAARLGAGDPLLVPFGARLVAGWIGPDADLGSAGRLETPACGAFGARGRGVEGFCRSHRQAIAARRVARLGAPRAGTITHFRDIALTALASLDEDAARDFVVDELGPLARRDDDTVRLAATLHAYLEERSSPRRTAKRLGVHENTVKNRVHTIEELRGHPANHRVAETLVALRLARVLGG